MFSERDKLESINLIKSSVFWLGKSNILDISLNTCFAFNVENVRICATLLLPYLFSTYFITSFVIIS